MERSNFLMQLKSALERELSPSEVQQNVEFYRNYIEDEMKNGKTEAEVLEMLGDPWAIAKTILTAAGAEGQERDYYTGEVREKKEKHREHQKVHVFGLDTWWKKAAAILSVAAIIVIVVSLILGILSIILPILIPAALIVIVIKMFREQ